jgi:hypothetical protein
LNVPNSAQKGGGFAVVEIFESLGDGILAPTLRIAFARLIEQSLECGKEIGQERVKLEFGRYRRRFCHDYIHTVAQRLP